MIRSWPCLDSRHTASRGAIPGIGGERLTLEKLKRPPQFPAHVHATGSFILPQDKLTFHANLCEKRSWSCAPNPVGELCVTAQSDPLVRTEVVALALGVAMNTARRYSLDGTLPPLTAQIPTRSKHVRAWPLSILAAHDPDLARRCVALLAVADLMKPLPKQAA